MAAIRRKASAALMKWPTLKGAAVELEGQRGEVGHATEHADQRRDEVLDEGGHHRGEAGPDDDADRQIDHVAPQDELPEPVHTDPLPLPVAGIDRASSAAA
jgi:hypothetical protein